MTYEKLKGRLREIGLSVKEFASLIGTHPNSITNYAKGNRVPTHIAIISSLMLEMHKHKVDYLPVFLILNPKKKKARGQSINR